MRPHRMAVRLPGRLPIFGLLAPMLFVAALLIVRYQSSLPPTMRNPSPMEKSSRPAITNLPPESGEQYIAVDSDSGHGCLDATAERRQTVSINSTRLPGVRIHRNVCLRQRDDRLETYERRASDQGAVAFTGTAFIFRDVCALGHTPKDITHLFSFSRMTSLPIHHVIYGHACMTRTRDDERYNGDVVLKRSTVFHAVLSHWFSVLSDGHIVTSRTANSYYEDFHEKNKTTPRCFRTVLERHEYWRWFDSPHTAVAFQRIFHEHFVLTPKDPGATLSRKLNILLVRRDEDRHFEEVKLVKYLTKSFSAVAHVTLAQFDKPPAHKLNADNNIDIPPYDEQIALLHKTDVLIAAHGAVLSSVVAMRPGTAVVEMFPNNYRYYMYDELARLLGLHYFAFEGSAVVNNCCRQRDVTKPLTRDTLNGDRLCKKCDIAWTELEAYYAIKNAMSAVWLGYARRHDVHQFDYRREK